MSELPVVLFIPFRDIAQPWLNDVIEPLEGRCRVRVLDPDVPFAEQVRGALAVVDQGGWGTLDMLRAAAEARIPLWQVLGTGLDHFNLQPALDLGLTVANTPGQFSSVSLAEHALLLMLCFAKNLDLSRENIQHGICFQPFNDDLEGRTLSLVGFGASGRELARRATAFGMRVLAVDAVPVSSETRDEFGLAFAGSPGDLDTILTQGDYVSLHVPLTPETAKLLNRRTIELLKPNAVIINVARGGLIDEDALLEALTARRIRGAGLDAFEHEPPDPAHPLFALDNVVATPHVAGATDGTSRRRGRAVAENMLRLLDGRPILHQVVRHEDHRA